MTKKYTDEELWKMDNYYDLIQVHKKCEGGPFFGNDLWKHLKKEEIPEPDIFKERKKK